MNTRGTPSDEAKRLLQLGFTDFPPQNLMDMRRILSVEFQPVLQEKYIQWKVVLMAITEGRERQKARKREWRK